MQKQITSTLNHGEFLQDYFSRGLILFDKDTFKEDENFSTFHNTKLHDELNCIMKL